MALEKTSDWIMLAFVTFSVPFYILLLLTILVNRRKEPFNSSFFILCTSLGVADIATAVHSYIFVKAPGWSWGHLFWVEYGYEGSFLAFYGHTMLWALSLAQHIGVLLIGINRFTAVVFTFRQGKIWCKRNIIIAISLQWIVPVLFIAPTITTDFEYSYWGGNGPAKYSDNVNIDFCNKTYEKAVALSGMQAIQRLIGGMCKRGCCSCASVEAYYISAVFINLVVNATTCSMYIAVLITALRVARKRKAAGIGVFRGTRDPTKTNDSMNTGPGPNRSLGNSSRVSLAVPVQTLQVEALGRRSSAPANGSPKWAISQIKAKFDLRRNTLAVAVTSHRVAFDRELRLAACGFLMFICMLVYFVFLLGVAVEGDLGFDFGWLWNIASDIFTCIGPYTLFIMSKQTRMALKQTLMCRKIS